MRVKPFGFQSFNGHVVMLGIRFIKDEQESLDQFRELLERFKQFSYLEESLIEEIEDFADKHPSVIVEGDGVLETIPF